MNREEFGKALKGHDWYYAYSDDSRSYRNGMSQASKLREAHAKLDCPFDMSSLKKWAHNMIVEQFAEETPGKWYRHPRKYKYVAACTREELMTQKEHDEVTHWLTLGGSIEGISQFV